MYKDFTVLTRPVHEVFYSIERKDKSILPPPHPMKMSRRKFNSEEYCDYHQSKGHPTKDCWRLKNAIEDDIRRGWLKIFVDKSGCKEDRPQRKKKSDDDDSDEDDAMEERKNQKVADNV